MPTAAPRPSDEPGELRTMTMDRTTFHKLLAFGIDRGVSDIHFEVGYPPHYRLHGDPQHAQPHVDSVMIRPTVRPGARP